MTSSLLLRHTWLLFMAVMCANAAVWWIRARPHIARRPELEEGYRSLIRGWLVYGNIPWVVMGAGILFGGVPTIVHYFDPRNGPFVIAFYFSAIVLWILTAYWVFLRGGAEALIRHPGLLDLPSQDPRIVKLLVALSLAGGVAGLTMM